MRAGSIVAAVALLQLCWCCSVLSQETSVHTSSCTEQQQPAFVLPPAQLNPALYAEWAHHHWVWLSHERANQTSMIQHAKDYMNRGIPVGAVDLDSGWETCYNNMQWDNTVYPDPAAMVKAFKAMNVRVIMWITSVVNQECPAWAMLDKNQWLIKNAIGQSGVIKWWHGKGSFIDYFHPDALAWWHKQMDPVLALGVDGWKADGTDPYIMEFINPISHKGPIGYHDYADAYYGDFFDYTRKANPDSLIMSRPCDDNAVEGIYLNMSPRRVVWSGWVGDNQSDFPGLQRALRRMFFSAYYNYPNFGSDIGGYLEKNKRTKEILLRWAGMSAFCPLMENGGNGEHAPWAFDTPSDNSTTDTYRKFVAAHMQLIPYFMTTGANAWEKNISSIIPVAPPPLRFLRATHGDAAAETLSSDRYEDDNAWPSSYDYTLGADMFVATIVENATYKVFTFPKDPKGWVSYWSTTPVYAGGSTVNYSCPLTSFPAFHRVATIIPLFVVNDYAGHGDEHSADALTLLINRPAIGMRQTREVREHKSNGLIASYDFTHVTSEGAPILSLMATGRTACPPEGMEIGGGDRGQLWLLEGITVTSPADLTVRQLTTDQTWESLVSVPSTHAVNRAAQNAQATYYHDVSGGRLFVRPSAPHHGVHLQITGVKPIA